MTRLAIAPRTVELVVAPGIDLSESGPIAWQVLKPVPATYHKRGSLDLSLDVLKEVAGSYDPAIDQAAINLDHQRSGSALGWIQRVWLAEDQHLWVHPVELAEELKAGILEKRIKRVSCELDPQHPETGGWYLSGLAVLGAQKPVIKGLAPITLSEAPRFRFIQENDMAPPTRNDDRQPAPVPADPPPTPAPAPAASPPVLDLSAQVNVGDGQTISLAELWAGHQQMTAQTKDMNDALDRMHLSEATTHIDRRLDLLSEGGRLNMMASRKLRPVLLSMATSGDEGRHQTLELSEKGDDGKEVAVKVNAVDAVLDALQHLPTMTLAGELGSALLAEQDDPNAPKARDRRTAEQRAIDLAEGISEEDALKMQQLFPGSF